MQIEQLLKSARSVDPRTMEVDPQFKEDLRETLYREYLDNISNETWIMKLAKKVNVGWKFGAIVSSVLAVVAVGLLGYAFMSNPAKDTTGEKSPKLAGSSVLVEGTAEYMAGDGEWVALEQGVTVEEGYSIKTGEDSKVVLELDNGSAVRLAASSEILLVDMSPERVVIGQVSGESYHRVVKSDVTTHSVVSEGVEAKALGTAYLYRMGEGGVEVLVYESDVLVSVDGKSATVSELKKGEVKPDEKEIEVKDMEEGEYSNDFAQWNREKDGESGFEQGDTTAPVVRIDDPANGAVTKSDYVTVTGKVEDGDSGVRKIKVNGSIYTSLDGDGYGFNPENGEYRVNVSVKEGGNTITVDGYDTYWNMGSASITVTREVEVEPTPQPTKYFYIKSLTSPEAGKMSLSWYMSGYNAPHGFKVVWSTSKNPVYPGSTYTYVSDGSTRSKSITGVSAGTYYVRVCIYNGSGGCTYYTGNKSVSVAAESTDGGDGYATSVNLSVLAGPTLYGGDVTPLYTPLVVGNYRVKLGWSISGGDAPKGFKVCHSESTNPVYPGSSCTYYSSPSTTQAVVQNLASGKTYYFRVGLYNGSGGVVRYSNQVNVVTP